MKSINIEPEFIRKEEQIRDSLSKLKKSHYKFYYMSVITNEEDYVLLDVVYEETLYDDIIEEEIDYLLLISEEPYLKVKMPSLDNLLIDKLTAFAPETIGILYSSEKYIEIIKQMYDISKISQKISFQDVSFELYEKYSEYQINTRELELSSSDTINDTIYTCLNILTKGEYDHTNFSSIERAINSFHGYVFGDKFNHLDAEKAAIAVLNIATIVLVKGYKRFNEILQSDKSVPTIAKFRKTYRALKGAHKFDNDGIYSLLENSLIVLRNFGFNFEK